MIVNFAYGEMSYEEIEEVIAYNSVDLIGKVNHLSSCF